MPLKIWKKFEKIFLKQNNVFLHFGRYFVTGAYLNFQMKIILFIANMTTFTIKQFSPLSWDTSYFWTKNDLLEEWYDS
jgi:hypothetical protein